jgi:type II secretory pathway pseudopilin PulG
MVSAASARGFALLAALLAVALVSLATLLPLRDLAQQAQREREAELIFAGRQIRDAIASYRRASPAGQPAYPQSLDELLADRRFPQIRRHLRRLYPDPMTGAPDWQLIREQGRIVGVHSSSGRAPIKRRGFDADLVGFDVAAQLAQWRFVATDAPAAVVAEAPSPPAPPGGPSPATPPGAPSPPAAPPGPRPGNDERRLCLVRFQTELTVCANTPPFDPACRQEARQRFVACLQR